MDKKISFEKQSPSFHCGDELHTIKQARLQKALEASGFDAFLFFKAEAVRYVTDFYVKGFRSFLEPKYVALVVKGKPPVVGYISGSDELRIRFKSDIEDTRRLPHVSKWHETIEKMLSDYGVATLIRFMKSKLSRVTTVLAFAMTVVLTAQAQVFPNKPIKIISPSPPGGGTDTTTRLVTAKVTELTQWGFVVDTRPGAGGNIGLAAGAAAPADGHTLVMGETSNLTVNQYLYKSMPLDPEKQLAPVALIGTGPLVLVVEASTPYRNLSEFIAAAKKHPLTYASSGSGTVGHLVSVSFQKQSGVEFVHVPYKGAGPAMTDLLGKQVDIYFSSLTAALPLVQSGKLKALAVTSAARVAALPNVPTLIEAGYPDFDYYVFYGVVAPARTPVAVVQTLNRAFEGALQTAELKAALAERGIFTQPGAPEAFGKFLDKERVKWKRIVRESGATVD